MRAYWPNTTTIVALLVIFSAIALCIIYGLKHSARPIANAKELAKSLGKHGWILFSNETVDLNTRILTVETRSGQTRKTVTFKMHHKNFPAIRKIRPGTTVMFQYHRRPQGPPDEAASYLTVH
jgi:hypothetical protein